MNFNRMTIRSNGSQFSVHKMKPGQVGSVTDMAQLRRYWYVSPFGPKFTGSRDECMAYIKQSGAEFMEEV